MLSLAPSAIADTNTTPIADIHGPNDTPVQLGKTVTVRGIVTAVYPKGGLDGFYLQTGGTGGVWDKNRTSSDAIFVYTGKNSQKITKLINTCVEVTGTVTTYPKAPKKGESTLTQIANLQKEITPASDPKAPECAPVKPIDLPVIPTDQQKEALESMLVMPTTLYTVTDNYSLGTYGLIGLTTADKPLPQATDVVAPGEAAQQLEKQNQAQYINLDDGSSWAYNIKMSNKGPSMNKQAVSTPLPYLTQNNPLRVGAKAKFINPVILTENHGWVYMPTKQITGETAANDLPVTITDNTRTDKPADVLGKEGDIKVSTFNLLNYFSDLGENEKDCKGYPDRELNPITANNCKVRGAYRNADFKRQETKLVNAINTIDADVFALEEVENSSILGKDRDEALKTLVAALNTAKKSNNYWTLVPSPQAVPNNGDAIRVAMIYKTATVKPVGSSEILDNSAFTGLARSPLAQKFVPIVKAEQDGKEFVLITNHFKSKGAHGAKPKAGDPNADTGDGQGYYNGARVAQAKALIEFTKKFAGTPTILVGDFNAYTMEDPIKTITAGGFELLKAAGHSYAYSGRVGSMDHAFANPAAKSLVTGMTVWEINAQEPVALEYSRFNNNITNFYKDDVYRASDHNPEVIGLNLITPKVNNGIVTPPSKPQPSDGNKTEKPNKKVPVTNKVTIKQLENTGAPVKDFMTTAVLLTSAGLILLIVRKLNLPNIRSTSAS